VQRVGGGAARVGGAEEAAAWEDARRGASIEWWVRRG